jgi:hypothetical protein
VNHNRKEKNNMETITTQRDLRRAFWADNPHLERRARKERRKTAPQDSHPTDTRVAWCDYVEYMERSGQISDSLAYRATL